MKLDLKLRKVCKLLYYLKRLFLVVSIARTDPIVIQHIHQGMERANEKAISRAAHVQVI